MIRIFNYLVILGLIILGTTACYYDNEEELYPQAIECDTVNVTYNSTVAPIMSNSCDGCHGGAAPAAGVVTDTYDGLKEIADNGSLWGSVNHDQDFSPMPKDLPKLNDCDLTKIGIWLDNGAFND